VYNVDDEYIKDKVKTIKAKKAGFSIQKNLRKEGPEIGCFLSGENMIYYDTERDVEKVIMNKDDMLLKGNHNVYNYLASVIMAKKFGIDDDVIEKTLCTFLGVEHRIEFVREINGINFYNDSKATNIDSMVMALKSFDRNIILILGGKRGDSYFSDIMDLMKEKVKKIIAIGETKNVIKEYFSSIIDVNVANTMKDAVTKAYKAAKTGDTILLSPAYKSFDMFDNFEHRGKEFKKAVLNIK
jgi:UDP-N-acetylmuramoylalanine--D-glutamate ligase